jgi:hypothetical protein
VRLGANHPEREPHPVENKNFDLFCLPLLDQWTVQMRPLVP